MVLAATLLAFAYIFASTAVPAMALAFRNAKSRYWITDFNATDLKEFGNPIVGSRLDYSSPSTQSWQLVQVHDDYRKFISTRKSGDQSFPISARFGNVVKAGAKFTAQHPGAGNGFVAVPLFNAYLYAFVTHAPSDPRKYYAITASTKENQSLTLENYASDNALQQWEIYYDPPVSGGLPIIPLELHPATRTEVLAATKEN